MHEGGNTTLLEGRAAALWPSPLTTEQCQSALTQTRVGAPAGCAPTLRDVLVDPARSKRLAFQVPPPAPINTLRFPRPSSTAAVLSDCVAPRQLQQPEVWCLLAVAQVPALLCVWGGRVRWYFRLLL